MAAIVDELAEQRFWSKVDTVEAADAVANMAYIDAVYPTAPPVHWVKSISPGGPTGASGDRLQAVSDPSLGGPAGGGAGTALASTAPVPHMRVYGSTTLPAPHAVMLSVVGFAETAKAWPPKIAAANPAITIRRRGWR